MSTWANSVYNHMDSCRNFWRGLVLLARMHHVGRNSNMHRRTLDALRNHNPSGRHHSGSSRRTLGRRSSTTEIDEGSFEEFLADNAGPLR